PVPQAPAPQAPQAPPTSEAGRRPGAWPTPAGGGTGPGAPAAQASGGRRPGAWPTPAGPGRQPEVSAPAPAPAAAPAAPAAAAPAPQGGGAAGGQGAAQVRQMWPDVLEAVKGRRRFTWILLSQNAHVAGFDGTTLQLGFSNPGARDSFVNGGSEEVLRAALADTFGVQWRIEAVVDPSGGAAVSSAQAPVAASARSFASTAPAAAPAGPPAAAPPAQPPAPRPQQPAPQAPVRRESEPPPPPVAPEDDMPAEDDPDLDDTALSGHDLIVRELGATVLEELYHE
ncbi:MAG TPA: DNA polymerase III subunit gamma and tau, partial [Streptomyces sp.]|nr:DNA polymerase III subunit gamma and tau [Streptomyces sp.]